MYSKNCQFFLYGKRVHANINMYAARSVVFSKYQFAIGIILVLSNVYCVLRPIYRRFLFSRYSVRIDSSKKMPIMT